MLVDEDLTADINLYLQELSNKITAEKLVNFLAKPEIKKKTWNHKEDKCQNCTALFKCPGLSVHLCQKGSVL